MLSCRVFRPSTEERTGPQSTYRPPPFAAALRVRACTGGGGGGGGGRQRTRKERKGKKEKERKYTIQTAVTHCIHSLINSTCLEGGSEAGGRGKKEREAKRTSCRCVNATHTHARTDTHCHPQPSSVAEHKLPNLDGPVCRRRRWELGPAHRGTAVLLHPPPPPTPPSPPATPSSFRRPSGPANVGHSSHMSHRPEQQPVCCRPQRAVKVCMGGWGGVGIGGKTAGSPTSAGTPPPCTRQAGGSGRSVRTNGVASGSLQDPPHPSPLPQRFLPGLARLWTPPTEQRTPPWTLYPPHTQPIGQENEKERAAGTSPSACKCARVSCASRRGRMKPWSRDRSLLKKKENLFSFLHGAEFATVLA